MTRQRLFVALTVSVVVFYLLALSTCSPRRSQLSWVKQQGVLRIATTNNPTTCYRGPFGPAGFECGLLRKFAAHIGVRLELDYVDNTPAALHALLEHRVDIAAASIVVGGIHASRLRYTLPIQQVSQQLVYRMGQPRPSGLGSLHGKVKVVEGSAAAHALISKSALYPKLHWQSTRSLGSEDLLYDVSDGRLDYTVAGSDLVAINRRYYPKLRAAFDLNGAQPIAWAMRRSADTSLFDAIQRFLRGIGPQGLKAYRSTYFKAAGSLDYLGVVRFRTDYKAVLPRYRNTFINAARDNGLDWRLLAAIGYQESRWNPLAVSPTGVRGLMMLTNDTAAQVNVDNREDATQSIFGAAHYVAWLLPQIPDAVPQPDRTWMALAAYNMGLGHLLDARKLTRARGGNPDRWKDVRKALPLLLREQWFDKTTYGYARGDEAQAFVDNVRSYYDLLVWFTGGQSVLVSRREAQEKATAGVKSSVAAPAAPASGASR